MQINALDKKFDEAIVYLQQAYDEIEKAASRYEIFPAEISLKSEVLDYTSTLFDIAEMIRELTHLKNVHRLFKLDDSTKERLFRAVLNNDDSEVITLAQSYTVTGEDTFELIAQKFGRDWNVIAEYNNIDSMELTAGEEIYIPYQIESRLLFEPSQIPVFTLQQGTAILGADLPDTLTADSDGDLTVLDNQDTFVQGMYNIAHTVEGRLPFYPDYGFKSWIGDEIPSEAREEWVKLQVEQSFLRDKRVERIPRDEMTVTRDTESYRINCFIYAIRGVDYTQLTVTA